MAPQAKKTTEKVDPPQHRMVTLTDSRIPLEWAEFELNGVTFEVGITQGGGMMRAVNLFVREKA